MKTILIIAFPLSFLLFTGFYQRKTSSLSGIVYNEKNVPLDFAYIKLYKNSEIITGTQTETNGKYLLKDIVPGVYDVEASFLGYKSMKNKGVIIEKGETRFLNFVLLKDSSDIKSTITCYHLIDIDKTITGKTITSYQIANLPSKRIAALITSDTLTTKICIKRSIQSILQFSVLLLSRF